MDGLLVLDKPSGLTSMTAVTRVKRALGVRKAGHTGTLDPMATGVLPICLGQATRISGYLLATVKSYRAEMMLGVSTDTHDAEGKVVSTTELSSDLCEESIREALSRWTGEVQQVPPAFSALKVKGQRAYKLAREGKSVELAPRTVVISKMVLESWKSPVVTFSCEVSKGTYIRSIVRDVGEALGCGAHMTALRRLSVGTFDLPQAVPLEVLQSDASAAAAHVIPLAALFEAYPAFATNAHEERLLRNGAIPHSFEGRAPLGDSVHRVLAEGGQLLALIEQIDSQWKLVRVFPH